MQDKAVALVTGANKGLGLQIAKDLVKHGFVALIGSRNLASGEAAAKSVGADARAIQIDVTDQTSIADAARRIRSEYGRLDVLVNNAAILHTGDPGMSIPEVQAASKPSIASLDEVRAVFETNVFGVIAVTQAMLALLCEAPAARIVNISSSSASLTLSSAPDKPVEGGAERRLQSVEDRAQRDHAGLRPGAGTARDQGQRGLSGLHRHGLQQFSGQPHRRTGCTRSDTSRLARCGWPDRQLFQRGWALSVVMRVSSRTIDMP